jgi:hypothetical protein
VKTLANESQERPVGDPELEQLHHLLAIDAVEEAADVCFQDPLDLLAEQHPVENPEGFMRAPPRPEPKRARQEVLLVDGLQHFAQRALYDLVLDGRDTDRAGLPRPRPLGDMHAPDRLMPVLLRAQPLVQVADVLVQMLGVFLFGHPVHARRCILADARERALQGCLIEVMRQRVEPGLRFSLRSLHYLRKSR